jgi:hypothetical protein
MSDGHPSFSGISGRMSDGHPSFSDGSGRMSDTGLNPTSVPSSEFFWMLMYDWALVFLIMIGNRKKKIFTCKVFTFPKISITV